MYTNRAVPMPPLALHTFVALDAPSEVLRASEPLSLFLSHSLTPSMARVLSLTLTLTLCHCHSHSLTLSLSLSPSSRLSLPLSLALSLSPSASPSLCPSLSLSFSLSLSLSLSGALSSTSYTPLGLMYTNRAVPMPPLALHTFVALDVPS